MRAMRSGSEKFAQFLRDGPFGSSLAGQDMENVPAVPVVDRFYPAGTLLVEEGEARRELIFIASGWALSSRSMPNGQRSVSDFLQRGDLMSCNTMSRNASSSIECASDVTTFEIETNRSRFTDLPPYLINAIMGRMARSNDIVAEHLASVARRRPIERLACLFLEMSYRCVQSGAEPSDHYDFPFTQRDLGDALGLTSIHINRLLRTLRDSNLVRFQHRTVELLNRKGLAEIASFDPIYLSLSANSKA